MRRGKRTNTYALKNEGKKNMLLIKKSRKTPRKTNY